MHPLHCTYFMHFCFELSRADFLTTCTCTVRMYIHVHAVHDLVNIILIQSLFLAIVTYPESIFSNCDISRV